MSESKIKEIFNLVKKLDTAKRLEILPPNIPLFSKLKDKYRFHLIIKLSKKTDPTGSYLSEVLKNVREYSDKFIPKSVMITIDVDAVNLL